MFKKIAFVLAFGLASTAFAATTATTGGTTPAPTQDAKVTCVGTAVNARESALGTAIGTYAAALQSAYGTRATALQTAYATGDATQVKSGIKSAWSAFSSAMKAATKSWKTDRASAWSAFSTAAKVCKAPASIVGSAGASSEASGQ